MISDQVPVVVDSALPTVAGPPPLMLTAGGLRLLGGVLAQEGGQVELVQAEAMNSFRSPKFSKFCPDSLALRASRGCSKPCCARNTRASAAGPACAAAFRGAWPFACPKAAKGLDGGAPGHSRAAVLFRVLLEITGDLDSGWRDATPLRTEANAGGASSRPGSSARRAFLLSFGCIGDSFEKAAACFRPAVESRNGCACAGARARSARGNGSPAAPPRHRSGPHCR